MGDLEIGRPVQELVRLGLVARQDAEGPWRELRHHVAALRARLRTDIDELAPLVRRRIELQHRERDRAADLGRQPLHPVDLLQGRVDLVAAGIACGARAREFEDALAEVAERAADPEQLVLLREGPGHRLAVDRAVAHRARRRETERAGRDAFLHDRGHLFDVLGRRGFVARAALAHHVGAHRAVRDVRAEVDGHVGAFECVEIFRERLPVPADALGQRRAGNVLHALHQADQHLALFGARRCETDAAVADDGRRHAVPTGGQQVRVPGRLCVVVGVDVDEARRHDATGGRDLAARFAAHLADCSDFLDAPIAHRDVAFERFAAAAIDDLAAANHEVVHAVPPAARPALAGTGWRVRAPERVSHAASGASRILPLRRRRPS